MSTSLSFPTAAADLAPLPMGAIGVSVVGWRGDLAPWQRKLVGEAEGLLRSCMLAGLSARESGKVMGGSLDWSADVAVAVRDGAVSACLFPAVGLEERFESGLRIRFNVWGWDADDMDILRTAFLEEVDAFIRDQIADGADDEATIEDMILDWFAADVEDCEVDLGDGVIDVRLVPLGAGA